jgi:FkbM family methyltransferase
MSDRIEPYVHPICPRRHTMIGSGFRAAAGLLAQSYRLHEAEIEGVWRWADLARQAGLRWDRAGSIGIDVGAALGVYTVALRRCCQYTLAVDPHPMHVSFIKRCAWDNVIAVEAAASDQDGQAWLHNSSPARTYQPLGSISPRGKTTDSLGFSVETMRLDTILRVVSLPDIRRIFLKIDAEGHEDQILDGLGPWMATTEMVILVEIEARLNPQWRDTLQKFAEHRYVGYIYHEGRLVRADPEPFIAAQFARFPNGPGRFARLKGYQNTFFFLNAA